jgi:hypothetical protein
VIVNRLDGRDLQRLADVLALPDPPELPGRGVHWTQAGDPSRRRTVLLPLLMRWAGHRCQLADATPMTAPRACTSAKHFVSATDDIPMRTA